MNIFDELYEWEQGQIASGAYNRHDHDYSSEFSSSRNHKEDVPYSFGKMTKGFNGIADSGWVSFEANGLEVILWDDDFVSNDEVVEVWRDEQARVFAGYYTCERLGVVGYDKYTWHRANCDWEQKVADLFTGVV